MAEKKNKKWRKKTGNWRTQVRLENGQMLKRRWVILLALFAIVRGVGITVEKNSSIFFLIRMC